MNVYQFFDKYKNVITGCNTYNDAILLINKLDITQDNKLLLTAYANSIKYRKILDNNEFMEYMDTINKTKYKEDCSQLITQILSKTDDISQVKCFMRLANIKPAKPIEYKMLDNELANILKDRDNKIEKNCPHCNHIMSGDKDTNYVICGYNLDSTGFDWQGCMRDWCFQCEGKLCKQWGPNDLFNTNKRTHDKECCKRYADSNNQIYKIDYCMCTNKHVNRNN